MEAAFRGVSPSRLLFSNRLQKSDFYSLLAVSDLFLDTRPYNSHTVATDALRGGLPMLSLLGSTFGSRVAASVSTAAKLDGIQVAADRKEYFDVGFEWGKIASNKAMAVVAKEKILLTVGKSLFNSTIFTSTMERATAAMSEISHFHNNAKARIATPSRNLFITSQ